MNCLNTATPAGTADSGSPYQAAVACDGLAFGGNSDWYVPALNEIQILYNSKAIIGNFGTGIWYWSATQEAPGAGSRVFVIDFSNGNVSEYYGGQDATRFLRCVRKN